MEEHKTSEPKTAASMQKKARQEAEGIRYIRSRTDLKDPKVVYQVYQNLIQQNIFETTVGLEFLAQMRRYLVQEGMIPGDNPTRKSSVPDKTNEAQKDKLVQFYEKQGSTSNVKENLREMRRQAADEKKKKEEVDRLQGKLKISIFFNIVLLISVIGIFLISRSGNQPTILNYETKLIDKYEAWEQDLQKREKEVEDKEQKLGMTR